MEDNGTAIGAALAASNILLGHRVYEPVTDYYGRLYDRDEYLMAIKKFPFSYDLIEGDQIYDKVASLIYLQVIIC